MKLNKEIKKENNNNKIFFVLMTFLLICLPFINYLFQRNSSLLIIYLFLLEGLILFSIGSKINSIYMKYELRSNIIKIKDGLIKEDSLIYCDKVKLIDTINRGSNIEIIVISTYRFRNKYLKPIDFRFLKKYYEINDFYNKYKKLYPDEVYYYQIIKNGNLKKYNLLNDIFKSCVKAEYTKSSIENIKIAREQEEF